MIIDIHTHTYPEKIAGKAVELLVGRSGAKAHTDGTLGGLKLSTANAGIDISVVLPVVTSPKQTEHINDVAAAEGTNLTEGEYSPLEAFTRKMIITRKSLIL